ncbi:MAG: hypothetical protein ACSW8I_06120, partial [bacterium]
FLALVLFTVSFAPQSNLSAQRPHGGKQEPRPDITELISDLSSSQKSKIETISNESKNRVDKLRKQQQAVRDSIALYMELEGDQAKYLYPLFDREARLQTLVSREMYSAKVQIDQILTKEQRQELHKSNQRHRKQHHKK